MSSKAPFDCPVAQVNVVPAGVASSRRHRSWHGKQKGERNHGSRPDRPDAIVVHLDLQTRIIGWRIFTDDDGSYLRRKTLITNGHGTDVAGTIAAQQETPGVVGVALRPVTNRQKFK